MFEKGHMHSTKRKKRSSDTFKVANMTSGERETVIRYDLEDRLVIIGTSITPEIRKCLKLKLDIRRKDEDASGKIRWIEFTLPLESFRWNKRKKRPKVEV
jgi:hypothetical protein